MMHCFKQRGDAKERMMTVNGNVRRNCLCLEGRTKQDGAFSIEFVNGLFDTRRVWCVCVCVCVVFLLNGLIH